MSKAKLRHAAEVLGWIGLVLWFCFGWTAGLLVMDASSLMGSRLLLFYGLTCGWAAIRLYRDEPPSQNSS